MNAEVMREYTRALRMLGGALKAFGGAGYMTGADLLAFCRSTRAAQEADYLRAHSRLPGSTRTKRLRKKRADSVARWWSAHA